MKRSIESLAKEKFDLLIIGAGIHGACAARDASLRGLKVAIIDMSDLCGATSHNSMKTIHGGIRYLQHLNIKRTIESIREQNIWLQTAPHLVKPLPFIMPTKGYGMRGPIAMSIGIFLYSLLSFFQSLRTNRQARLNVGKVISRSAYQSIESRAKVSKVTGAAVWNDAQVEFANRATLEILEHASQNGAQVCNYVKASELIYDGSRIVGVKARDILGDKIFNISSKITLNAAGPWVAEVLGQGQLAKTPNITLNLSKSMNLVTTLPASKYASAFESSHSSDSKIDQAKRQYFVVPWLDRSIIGTTHFTHPRNKPSSIMLDDEVNSYMSEVNDLFTDIKLTQDDVLYCYHGITPGDNDTQDSEDNQASRLHHSLVLDHMDADKIEGLISIISVKWTTARLVAEKAIDGVTKKLDLKARSSTRVMPIPMCEIPYSVADMDELELVRFCETHYQQTMARNLDDILFRRTEDLILGYLDLEKVKTIAKTMAKLNTWTSSQKMAQQQNLSKYWLPKQMKEQLLSSSFWD